METLERILADHPFFSELDRQYVELLAGCASNVRFTAGSWVVREGAEASQFYLIREGRIALEIASPSRSPLTVETLEEGGILGWSWLIPPHTWSLDARATELTRAIALDGKCLRLKCEENHDLGYELLKRFARILEQHLEATRLQLVDIYAAHR
jgi:CRP/FNR family transcriptional regulator, cyclic AMP receptor protein